MYLDKDVFARVDESTPLISIDLVVENSHGEILLGWRKNRPAKNSWFVPGGRVQKNETLELAFQRLCVAELGIDVPPKEAQLKGVYEHFYTDSVFGEEISTHYIVIAYRLNLAPDLVDLPKDQHEKYIWMDKKLALLQDDVHCYTKQYIEE